MEEAKAEQVAARQELKERRAELQTQLDEADALVRKLESDQAEYQDTLDALDKEEEAIQAEIIKKSRELAAQNNPSTGPADTGVVTSWMGAGGYMWPEKASKRITSPMGSRYTGIPGASTNHKGVDIGGGDHTLPAELTILENGENPRVSVIICEGMYHQIKRMFERFGYQVIYLKREQIGGLPLDPALPKGACRELTDEELRRLEEKEGEDAQ